VGTYANLEPALEERALGKLGLRAETVPTQVVGRDRHAELVGALALVGAAIEQVAVTVRHWQRTEVGEAEEPFGRGQKGSSAMPHKKNPILSENLTGLARLLRAYAGAAYEDVALWHERDISHSSVERVILPDATTLAHFMLSRATRLVEGLLLHPERMLQNLERTRGLVFSEGVMLALVRSGLPRQRAYEMVQRNALAAHSGQGTLRELCGRDPEISARLPPAELDRLFDLDHHLRHARALVERALAEEETSSR
jgi:adenylosuccinate lyase